MKIITIALIAISLWVELLYVVINSHWSLVWVIYCVLFGGAAILCLAGISAQEIKKPKRHATRRL